MRVLVSGASGLIGSAVARRLSDSGHDVFRLVRRNPIPGRGEIFWNPAAGQIDRKALEASGVEAVVNLAGENHGLRRWTEEKKALITSSRVEGTALLARTLADLPSRPSVFLSGSAIAFYGTRGDEELSEQCPPGTGFLADMCCRWESAARPAADAGIRVALLRTGIVLDTVGGFLALRMRAFRWGLGGPFGSGEQYVSWITRDDAIAAIVTLLAERPLAGPVNLVSPQPVTNREFAKAIGRALHRPALLRTPARFLRRVLGEIADELLLRSVRVIPRRLLDAGFVFRDPNLPAALARLLGKPG